MLMIYQKIIFFFFNDTATTEIYTLSLHDALPIWPDAARGLHGGGGHLLALEAGELARDAPVLAADDGERRAVVVLVEDRKSTRLNSSHSQISYAVFCLKKKKKRYAIH